jgi:hypothetical protein
LTLALAQELLEDCGLRVLDDLVQRRLELAHGQIVQRSPIGLDVHDDCARLDGDVPGDAHAAHILVDGPVRLRVPGDRQARLLRGLVELRLQNVCG